MLGMNGAVCASGLSPLADSDFYDDGRPSPEIVELGRLLFYDKILSGNRNIACATCHHPAAETGDALRLSIGEGGAGLARQRDLQDAAVASRVPRNAQPLFNLGAKEFTVLFHDGRVELDDRNPERIRTPMGDALPDGVNNVLAAQALFPLLSSAEMAGDFGENDIADAVSLGNVELAWERLTDRVRGIPGYVDLFRKSMAHVESADDIRITDIANAIAAFTAVEWRADDSPFDRYLRGDKRALTTAAAEGYQLFYGDAGCADCHAGTLQTDHRFHALAVPQLGPGKGHGSDGHDDIGRAGVTGNPADRYRFRTPSLRNVAHTGPWGHSGAFDSLEAVVRHHIDPAASLLAYQRPARVAPASPHVDGRDFLVQDNPQRLGAIADAAQFAGVALTDRDVRSLLAFLDALTDERSLSTDDGVPSSVPSGLPVAD